MQLRKSRLLVLSFCLAILLLVDPAQAAVYNLHLVTDNVPDYTDMASLVRSSTDAWQTPQDKCIAVWRWGRRSRRQTSCADEDGRTVWDPILHYNSYGSMNCGIISSLNIASWLQLGYRARYIQLGDHTVSEVSWDEGKSWHLFDSSMSIFCYNHEGAVASCEEIKQAHACELSGGKSEPGRPAYAVFNVSAANVITSMRIEADGLRRTEADRLKVLVSRSAGMKWEPVGQAEKTGPQPIRLALRDEVAGVTQCLIKFEMLATGDKRAAGLDRLRIVTTTQVNRRTLPSLALGVNQVMLWADESVETTEVWPALHAGAYRRSAAAEEDVFSDKQPDGFYKATLGAGVDGKPCSATWKLDVPGEISDVSYAVVSTNRNKGSYVSLQHSWDGQRFVEFDHNAADGFPFDKQVHHALKGRDVPAGARQAEFRAVFFCKSGAATYNMPGIEDLLFRVRHKPRNAAFQPVEVTYEWTEHRNSGDVVRGHTELVRSLPHRWAIDVAGRRDPTMSWVRINLQGHGPEDAAVRYGYSDGEDVGPRDAYRKVAYRFGKELARGKSYTASRASSVKSGNPDSDGRELTNGIIIAPTDYMTAKAVQPATAFWDPGEPVTFVVDLGESQTVGGFRVWTHQPNDRFCHPKSIEIAVSADGRAWKAAGTIAHDDLWKPPGDFEAWEHDDDPRFAQLPAGGRLAYGYPLVLKEPVTARYVRLVCTPLEGKGMGLSEFQVFQSASVAAWPREVVLPF